VTRSQARRFDSAQKTRAPKPPERRTHLLWKEPDDTAETIRAQIRQMIASGQANQGDRFVTCFWRSTQHEGDDI
jgi:hypothetical protein